MKVGRYANIWICVLMAWMVSFPIWDKLNIHYPLHVNTSVFPMFKQTNQKSINKYLYFCGMVFIFIDTKWDRWGRNMICTLCCRRINDFYLISKMEKQHHLIHLAYIRICIHIVLPSAMSDSNLNCLFHSSVPNNSIYCSTKPTSTHLLVSIQSFPPPPAYAHNYSCAQIPHPRESTNQEFDTHVCT